MGAGSERGQRLRRLAAAAAALSAGAPWPAPLPRCGSSALTHLRNKVCRQQRQPAVLQAHHACHAVQPAMYHHHCLLSAARLYTTSAQTNDNLAS